MHCASLDGFLCDIFEILLKCQGTKLLTYGQKDNYFTIKTIVQYYFDDQWLLRNLQTMPPNVKLDLHHCCQVMQRLTYRMYYIDSDSMSNTVLVVAK